MVPVTWIMVWWELKGEEEFSLFVYSNVKKPQNILVLDRHFVTG